MNSVNSKKHQRGVSLIFALLALVALSLATLALVRSVDTGAMLLGNVGFKQDATVAGDQASRQAVAWLKLNAAALDADAAANGYYASTREVNADLTRTPVDVTGQQSQDNTRRLIDWSDAQDSACSYATAGTYASCNLRSVAANMGGNPNQARYVIFRLCANSGSAEETSGNSCAKPLSASGSSSSRGDLSYGGGRISSASGPYYRIVVRVLGGRNATSFTETIVNFQ